MRGTVERQFVHDVHLGETVLPFRVLTPLKAVLPVTNSGVLTATEIEEHSALAAWWQGAEATWDAHKSKSDDSALLDRIDFHGQLAAQLPAAAHRVVYTKAGNTLASARLAGETARAVIDHKLYWAAVSGVDEARYLTAILNSDLLLERVRPLQALGLFGGRDFDKNVFSVLIPTYTRGNSDHQAVADLAAEAEAEAAGVVVDPAWTFQRARSAVRQALNAAGLTKELAEAVARAVPPVEVPVAPG